MTVWQLSLLSPRNYHQSAAKRYLCMVALQPNLPDEQTELSRKKMAPHSKGYSGWRLCVCVRACACVCVFILPLDVYTTCSYSDSGTRMHTDK